MKTKKYVGTAIFDIDGVLCDVEAEFCDRFGNLNRRMYNFYDRYPDKVELINEFLNDKTMYREAFPVFGGIKLLNQARRLGWYIYIMTSRPFELEKTTIDWLNRYNIEFEQLSFIADKASFIKEMVTNKPMFLIDDCVEHLDHLPEHVTGIAWEQPWNVDYFPKARYDQNSMKVQKKLTPSQPYTDFWK